MLSIERTSRFKRDVKRISKRGKDSSKLKKVILLLVNKIKLPERFRDHCLSGRYEGTRECHIEPDWLLIYTIVGSCLRLERTGTHADLFG